ncbi:MAG TPA: MoaD/ThiS family protein [Thermoanaerobaculia bacterium]|nr:MoaD/ThiS family protein [Thermoanaerobaculia bacterium]
MRVRMLYFAVLRDIIGKSEADVMIPEGTRAAEVWQMLRRDHRELAGYEQPPLTAINENYAAPDSVLREGDELAFIPPVAGG